MVITDNILNMKQWSAMHACHGRGQDVLTDVSVTAAPSRLPRARSTRRQLHGNVTLTKHGHRLNSWNGRRCRRDATTPLSVTRRPPFIVPDASTRVSLTVCLCNDSRIVAANELYNLFDLRSSTLLRCVREKVDYS